MLYFAYGSNLNHKQMKNRCDRAKYFKPYILKDSKLLEEAGIFSIVLECVETKLAKKITEQLKIPTIGIGSSAYCDGQVLVIDDLLGISKSKFRFVKKYANINQIINSAVKNYKSDVLKKQFPKSKHSFNNR